MNAVNAIQCGEKQWNEGMKKLYSSALSGENFSFSKKLHFDVSTLKNDVICSNQFSPPFFS
jgi:hypothetical protein